MEDKVLIGLRLRELRNNLGYSQERAAEIADMASSYLSKVEKGKENPTVDTLLKLARAYKVNLWELLNYGHELTRKELEATILNFVRAAKDDDLRLLLKFINTLNK